MTKYVDVEIDLDNDILFKLMSEAHENDVTLNEFCRTLLKDYMKKLKKTKGEKNEERRAGKPDKE